MNKDAALSDLELVRQRLLQAERELQMWQAVLRKTLKKPIRNSRSLGNGPKIHYAAAGK